MQLKSLFFLVLILFLFSGCKNDNLKDINNNEYSLSYPKYMVLEDNIDGVEFILFTERKNVDDTFIENINLIIQDFGNMDLDLDKYVEISEEQISEDNGKLISSETKTTENSKYQRLIYSMKMNNRNLMYLQHYHIHKNKAYILTFSSDKDEFKNYVDEMEKIMLSFKPRN